MAIISGLYVFVLEENIDSPVAVSQHPIESGGVMSDHVRADPLQLSVTGEIVGDGWYDTVWQLRQWQRQGMVVSYVGVNIFSGAQILAFSYKNSGKIDKGCEFSMTLQEVRVARSLFDTKIGYLGPMEISVLNNDGTIRVENLSEQKERYHTLGPGETLYYVAGQYRSRGVSVESLQAHNGDRAVFVPGHRGDFAYLLPGAKLLLGVW